MIAADPVPEPEAKDEVEPEKAQFTVLIALRHRYWPYLNRKRAPLRP